MAESLSMDSICRLHYSCRCQPYHYFLLPPISASWKTPIHSSIPWSFRCNDSSTNIDDIGRNTITINTSAISHGFIFGYSPGMLYLYWSKELGEKGRAFTIGDCVRIRRLTVISLAFGWVTAVYVATGKKAWFSGLIWKGFWCPRLGGWHCRTILAEEVGWLSQIFYGCGLIITGEIILCTK
jgi:hypothetical protein